MVEAHAAAIRRQAEQLQREGAGHPAALGLQRALQHRAPVTHRKRGHRLRGVCPVAHQCACEALALVHQQQLPAGADHGVTAALWPHLQIRGEETLACGQVDPAFGLAEFDAHRGVGCGLEIAGAEEPRIGAIREQSGCGLAGTKTGFVQTHRLWRFAALAVLDGEIGVEPLVDVAARTADLYALVDHRRPRGDEVHDDGFFVGTRDGVPEVLGLHVGAVEGHVRAVERRAGHADVVVRNTVCSRPGAGADGGPVRGRGGGQRHHRVRRKHACVDQPRHGGEVALAAVLQQRGRHRAVEAEDQNLAGRGCHRSSP